MACTSCGHPLQTCNCTTYTLPVGPTGAAGAAGATGPTGPAGAVVIADIQVNQATTTTGSYETLYTYTLTNPSPLDEAGDILEIYSYWSDGAASTASRAIRVQIGGNTINGIGYGLLGGAYLNQSRISLSRVTSTTAALSTQELVIGSLGNVMANLFYHLPNQLNASYQTVNNGAVTLDSGALTITFQANSASAGDIHLDRIVILKLEKV